MYCFVIFWQQFRPELDRNKPVQGIFPILFSNLQDGRTSPLIKAWSACWYQAKAVLHKRGGGFLSRWAPERGNTEVLFN